MTSIVAPLRRLLAPAGAIIAAMTALGCSVVHGNGQIETQSHRIEVVDHVSVTSGFLVHLHQGTSPLLAVTVDENLQDEVQIRQSNGSLAIGWTDGSNWFDPTERVEIDLVLPTLRSVELSGGSRLEAEDLALETLLIEVHGGSRARLNGLEATRLDVDLSGGSTGELTGISVDGLGLDSSGGSQLEAVGTSRQLDASISGGGKLEGACLVSLYADLDLSGGSRADVAVADQLDVEAAGGSKVTYRGSPTIHENVSGASRVVAAEDGCSTGR